MKKELKNRFCTLLETYTANTSLIDDLWNNLEKRYSEKHRTYHNLKHLKELFDYFDFHHEQLENPNIVAFSIFYHDIIYNIWKKDNEEKSADLAIKVLSELQLSQSQFNTTHEQIIATKTHESNFNDSKFLIDFDLAILGQSEEIYQEYSQSIRKEYKLVPDFMYKKGRIKVLQHFINKKNIYKTAVFIASFEKNAKENLQGELNQLLHGI